MPENQAVTSITEKFTLMAHFRTYLKCCCDFAIYCKEKHGAKDLISCHQHIDEYLGSKAHLSAWTQKTYAAAIGKLYGESSTNYSPTQNRARADIIRGRKEAIRKTHFSESRNHSLIVFARSSGLRRSEISCVRGTDLVSCSSSPTGYGIHVRCGKGGRERTAPLYCNQQELSEIVSMCNARNNEKVFSKVHSCCNIHGYRADYALKVYSTNAKPISELQSREKYVCRKDMKQVVYDRAALKIVSEALGHSRISIVPASYLYRSTT